jgi:hypothetical protein
MQRSILRFSILLFFCFFSLLINAQTTKLTLKFSDSVSQTPLQGIKCFVFDTSYSKNIISDENGFAILVGNKVAFTSLIYFFEETKYIVKNLNLLKDTALLLEINTKFKSIEEVVVRATGSLMKAKGDTLEMSSSNFKVNVDATAEDLIKKMPGVTIENGRVTAQGEQVAKIYIDGQEFFGDDPSMTLKNLPAGAIEKVQVFDKQSDQTAFTGFKDGNGQKTINIITKKSFKQSVFGKAYAGYGTKEHYNVGASLNYFNGVRRIAVLGNFNNINVQNFSPQDIMGATGASGPGGGMGRMMGGMNPNMMGQHMASGSMDGSSNFADFFTGTNAGINAVNGFGLNYSDKFKNGLSITTSYFANQTKTSTIDTTVRTYFINDSVSNYYNAKNNAQTLNTNHRINLRLALVTDSMNSIIFSPKITLQTKNVETSIFNNNLGNQRLLNLTNSLSNNKANAYVFSGSLLWNHKFLKLGRTLSINVSHDRNRTDGNLGLDQQAQFYQLNDTIINGSIQNTKYANNSETMSGSFAYTEPISKNSQLKFTYNPSITTSRSERSNAIVSQIGIVKSQLNGFYDNAFQVQRAGIAYAYNFPRMNVNGGFNVQHSALSGVIIEPITATTRKNFLAFLPNAFFTFKINKDKNWRLNYQTSITAPSTSQLQPVADNSNPNAITIGNSDLNQQYEHSLGTRYSYNNPVNFKSFFVAVNSRYTTNYLGNATTIASADTNVNGNAIKQGMQINTFENFKQAFTFRTFSMYGFKIKPIKSNMNLNAAVTHSLLPMRINGLSGFTRTTTSFGNVSLGSNVSPKIDFNLSYNLTYSFSKNTLNKKLNNNYWSNGTTGKLTLNPYKGLVIATDLTFTKFFGLRAGLPNQVLLWNAEIGYKFLKNKQADLRLSVFDILKKNQSINRSIQANYVEDVQTQVLTQYYMLTFTYTIKQAISKKPETTSTSTPVKP